MIVLLGLAAIGFAEYQLFLGKYFFGALTEPLWQSVRANWKSLAAAKHLDLAAAAAAGIVLAIIGFFYAQSKRALAVVPLAILIATTAATAGIVAFESSLVGLYVNVAGAPGPKTPPEQNAFTSRIPQAPPEQNAFTSRIPQAPPEVQGRLPKYATVNAGNAALGLRSCPVTCPVVAWVPTGATVRIVGSGEKGWQEVETTTAEPHSTALPTGRCCVTRSHMRGPDQCGSCDAQTQNAGASRGHPGGGNRERAKSTTPTKPLAWPLVSPALGGW